jgi:hypothetical protein
MEKGMWIGITEWQLRAELEPKALKYRKRSRARPGQGLGVRNTRINWITPPGGIIRGFHIFEFGHGGVKKEGV